MATRYLIPGGDGNYNSTSNWSATDGGVSGATFPVAVDDIIINANSLNAPITVNVVSACKSFSASNYTGIWTISNDFSVNGTTNTGNITLSSGMTITGPASFIKVPTSTTGVITSNGAIFDCNFIFQAAAATTTTITGAMQVNKNITWSLNSTAINTINSGTISVGGDIIHNSPVAGTSPLQMIGSTTATITQVVNRYLQTNLIINKTGILNQVDLYWGTNSRTLTYTAGIVNHTGTLFVSLSNTLNTNGISWNTISLITSSASCTLSSLLTSNTITTAGASISFLGSGGFLVSNFIQPTSTNGATVTLAANVTYRITNNLTQFGIGSGVQNNMATLRCSSASRANLILSPNAICKLAFVNILNINASGGKTLRVLGLIPGSNSKGATVTNSINCFTVFNNITQYSTTI
jgi:hypothetical protein